MSKQSKAASSRIPLNPTTHVDLREFRNGLDVSFDEAVALLLHVVKKDGEDFYSAGKRLRERLNEINSRSV